MLKQTMRVALAVLAGATAAAAQPTRGEVVERYADLLLANYEQVLSEAGDLRIAIDSFTANATPEGLETAKQAWLAARPAYLQTEMARFYDGPIDNAETGPEGFINAWPLDEAYIDYVGGGSCGGDCDAGGEVSIDELIRAVGIALGSAAVEVCASVDADGDGEVAINELVGAVGRALDGCPVRSDGGIVNAVDLYPVITPDVLVELNEGESETTISSGWHAIELLLWGQDQRADGPGQRPYTDYVTSGGGTATNQDRRNDYLRAAGSLLITHLQQVRDAWATGNPNNYRAEFLAADPDEALRRILTGMGTLSGGELTGERLAVAFETKDQEDEHSCFSDNTHVDHLYDEVGIQNAFLGRFGDVAGPGIYDLVAAEDQALADATRDAIAAARAAIDAIPEPFDQAILGDDSTAGRQAISAAIAALEVQTDLIAQCAEALGIPISTTLP